MKLTFWGAARQVTGSMFLLELESKIQVLIDCGSDMARIGEDSPEEIFPFNPSDLDVVLLTHAHTDHSGNIPNLIRNGYKGQILSTSATFELTKILLQDSAAIHGRKLRNSDNKRRSKRNIEKEAKGLYLAQDVDEATDQFVTIGFHKRFEVSEDLAVTFIPTGHLLGAANIILEVKENGQIKKIAFSGDIGRKNYPLLKDPEMLPQVDYIVCESTYGSRKHSQDSNPEAIIEQIINEACVDKPGRLIIPAFSVGRTQSILYTLNKLTVSKKLPAIKIFADSPMAEESTRVYENNVDLMNEEAKEFKQKNNYLFDFENLVYVDNFKESKAISNYLEPCIIISSSGMLTGGRMQHHIKKNVNNPYSTILLIGYCAEGTPGYSLYQRSSHIRIKGKDIPVMATVLKTDVFSGHGDQGDLIGFIKSQSPEALKKVFLVHGEYESMLVLKEDLAKEGYANVEIPKKGQSYLL